MRGRIGIVALVWVAGASAAAAPPETSICTDRPGKSSSTCTVPKGYWQIESSVADWSLTKSDGTRSTSLAIGATALKYGVSESMHVEVEGTPYVRNRERSDDGGTAVSGIAT